MPLDVIILAAGQGKRMYSAIPKVLHPIAGKPMLQRVIETAIQLSPANIHVIIGHGGEQVQTHLATLPVNWITQDQQLGTGHAVLQALPFIPTNHHVLVLSGDVPLISADILTSLTEKVVKETAVLGLLLATMADPTGLGRIIRDHQQNIVAIVEEKDASAAQKNIQEIYTGICCAQQEAFMRWLPKLTNQNAQGEFYLTDIIAMAVQEHSAITSVKATDILAIQGINNRIQLNALERAWQFRAAQQLMASGVTLADGSRFDIRGELVCEQDVFIDVNVIFAGKVHLKEGCSIGPQCTLTNVTIGKNTVIKANSVLEDCVIGEDCEVGPFARIRAGTVLGSQCKIGNFVETKKAVFDVNSKASHLTYLGDVTIGKNVNIGAGTITCNYDGANKHQTVIEDGAFIGSDTQLVAPVTVGRNATIGAGSTIRKSAPAEALTLTESRQKTVHEWSRPQKKTVEEKD